MVLLKKGKSFLLEKTGRMIGIKKSDHYESKNIDFVPGDRLYLFTDGLVEEFDSNEEQFEEDKLYKILENNYKINLGDSIVKVLEQLDEFLDGQERQDDITILGIYFKS
jgi:serine phosphatase RsbU (regulator of sigma subunit)